MFEYLGIKEKLFILTVVTVLALAVKIYFGVGDPRQKYYQNEKYCQADFDCAMVYDITLTEPKCLVVNNLNKYKYDNDPLCWKIKNACRQHLCVIETK